MGTPEQDASYRRYWLDVDPHIRNIPIAARETGLTEDQYMLFSRLMRRPVYEWLELRSFPRTEAYDEEHRISERAQKNREQAVCALREFLSQHPQISIPGLRSLIDQVVGLYYIVGREANPHYKFEKMVEDTNLFIDEAMMFFQEMAQDKQHPTANLETEAQEIKSEIGRTTKPASGEG